VKKSYEDPQTPYQRVLVCRSVSAADKLKLKRQYKQLNPAALKRDLDKLRKQLFALAARKKPLIQLKTTRHKQKPMTIRPQLIQ